jgi:cytochrome c peroxidase
MKKKEKEMITMINLTDKQKIEIQNKLIEVKNRVPTNSISATYLKSIETLSEEYDKWLAGKENCLNEESLNEFMEIEGLTCTL